MSIIKTIIAFIVLLGLTGGAAAMFCGLDHEDVAGGNKICWYRCARTDGGDDQEHADVCIDVRSREGIGAMTTLIDLTVTVGQK